MKFLMIVETNPSAPPPSPEALAKLDEYSARNIASGVVALTGGVRRPSKGIKVEQAAGKVSFTDGPYAESKELIDGYAIVNAKSLAEAKSIAAEFMVVANCGKLEILEMFDYGGHPPTENH